MRILQLTILLLTITSCSVNKKIAWIRQAGSVSSQTNGFSICSDSTGYVYVTGNFTNQAVFEGKDTIIAIDDDDCYLAKYTSSGKYSWVKNIGGTSGETGNSVVVDKNGNVVLAGNFWNNILINDSLIKSKGNSDIFIIKYTDQGNQLWFKTIGGIWMDDVHQVLIDDQNNIFIVGRISDTVKIDDVILTSNGDIDGFVLKLDEKGKEIWGCTIGGKQDDEINHLSIDGNSNIFISGTISDTVYYSGDLSIVTGYLNEFIGKLSCDGKILLLKTFGEEFLQETWDMSIDNKGSVYISGFHCGSIKIDGIEFPGAPDNDYAMYLAKFSNELKLIWFKHYFGKGNGYGHSIAIDNENNIHLAGSFYKNIEIANKTYKNKNGGGSAIIKFNENGEILDNSILSNKGSNTIWEINHCTFDKSILCVGHFTGKLSDSIKTKDKRSLMILKLK